MNNLNEIRELEFNTKDGHISANWSINDEQDMRNMFNLSMKEEVIGILQHITIDREK